MEYKLSHQQRLLQKMSLTPQMRQSIQILSLSIKDLNEYIDSVVTNNPFLQKLIDEKRAEKYRVSPSRELDNALSNEYTKSSKQDENPRLSLLSQLGMLGLKGKTLEIAEYLIYEMDENGYIKIDLEEAANDLSVSLEEAQKTLDLIQGMEPAGIGAADVRECLQLQLKRQGKEDSLDYEIVTSFLNELAQNNAQKISKELKADEGHVRDAIHNIKKLNPRPASTMLSKEAERIIPDLIAKVENRNIRLELNRESIPHLKIYNPYEKKLDIIKDPEARKFLSENIDFANGLIDNLKRREETICSVANYILSVQQDALAKDRYELKSLTMKDVARALDFHPSTISRAVSNKFIQVNDKVIPLKSLLSHGIKKVNGELTSKTAVKNRIEALFKNEDKARPLSDKIIQERLAQDGIMIERRTIAKYRHSLRILPTYLRKKAKPV